MTHNTNQSTQALLKKHNLHIKKKFGQNFLVDDNTIQKIIRTADVNDQTTVIEVGPGLGAISKSLQQNAKGLIAYEIDDDLIPVLNDMFSAVDNFKLYHKDFLKTTIDEDIDNVSFSSDKLTMVANLPYYITTPILMKCLESSKRINRLVLMTQYEVARRLTASKNTKDYNALSVMIHYLTNATFEFKVSRNVFIPAPNVDSAVISLTRKESLPDIDEAFFFDFIKQAFKQKRKTLVNNLHAAYGLPKADIIKTLETESFNPSIRAEGISPQEFVNLSEIFKNIL